MSKPRLPGVSQAVTDAADPLFVEILAVIQKRHPGAFGGDFVGAVKSINAVLPVLSTLMAAVRLHSLPAGRDEFEDEILVRLMELADTYEAGAQSVGATLS